MIKKKRKKAPCAEDVSARPDIGPGAGRATIAAALQRFRDNMPAKKTKSDALIAYALSIAHTIA